MHRNNLLVCGLVFSLFVASACQYGSKTEQESGRSRSSALSNGRSQKVSLVSEIYVANSSTPSPKVGDTDAGFNASGSTQGTMDHKSKETNQCPVGHVIQGIVGRLGQIKKLVNSNEYSTFLELCNKKSSNSFKSISRKQFKCYEVCRVLYRNHLAPLKLSSDTNPNRNTDNLRKLYDFLLSGKADDYYEDGGYNRDSKAVCSINVDTLESEYDAIKATRINSTLQSDTETFVRWFEQLKGSLESLEGSAYWRWHPSRTSEKLALHLQIIQYHLKYIAHASTGNYNLSSLDKEKLGDFWGHLADFYEVAPGDPSIPFNYFANVDFDRSIEQIQKLKEAPDSLVKKSSA